MMDSFSPTFKWIGPRTSELNCGLQWSCEIEVSHTGKKPISYRQRWDKIIFCQLLTYPNSNPVHLSKMACSTVFEFLTSSDEG